MKKFITYLVLLCFFSGCEEVIEKRELNAVDEANVWEDATLANLFLNDLYRRTLPGFSGNSNAGLPDETFSVTSTNESNNTNALMYGMLTAFQALPYDNIKGWDATTYSHIRRYNMLLSEIDKGSIPENEKNLMKAQALMMRAWTYWEMIKLYGGVPMVMRVQDPNEGEGLYMERDKAATAMALIIRDLDEAIEKLPVTWPASEYGRFTKAAAASLKGRILLYYASPQFNPNNLSERWQAAYEANMQAKQLAQAAGHALHPNFSRIFLDEGNKEAILVRVFVAINGRSHGYEASVRPASTESPRTTSAGNPTWDFVKAFPMIDGKPIEGHQDYDSRLYWKNRDPRLSATVAYNSVLYPLPLPSAPTTIVQNRRQWTYEASNEQPNNVELAQNTRTGFYLRKMVNPGVSATELSLTPTDWIEIRYAEVLLNLAEAANEVGKTDEALTELKAIRQRAGIQAGDGNFGLVQGMSKEAMREAIMLERQIELAFENKRHWDLRRRNLFVNKLNGTRRTGLKTILDLDKVIVEANIQPTQAELEMTEAQRLASMRARAKTMFEATIRDNTDWNNDNNHLLYFRTEEISLDERGIEFKQPLYNFYPVPVTNMEKDPKIKQTIGWTDGGFDPLQP